MQCGVIHQVRPARYFASIDCSSPEIIIARLFLKSILTWCVPCLIGQRMLSMMAGEFCVCFGMGSEPSPGSGVNDFLGV